MAEQRHKYTAEERIRILKDVAKLGVKGAARKHGVPASSVSRWNAEQKKQGGDVESRGEPTARPKRVARIYTPSQRAEALELAEKVGGVEAARRLGMSRVAIWDWLDRTPW